MFGHYLAMTLGKFRKAPFTTLANIVTLALGLACFIAAWGIATWWQSADTYHSKADRTIIVGSMFKPIGGEMTALNMRSPSPVARHLENDFPEFELVTRSFTAEDIAVAAGESKQLLNLAVAEPGFLNIFDFDYVAGDASALAQPGSVMLTEETAARLFPNGSAMGGTVRIANAIDARVAAVIKPVRQPSFMGAGRDAVLRFDLILDWATSPTARNYDQNPFWPGTNVYTTVLLKPGVNLKAINARLPGFVQKNVPEQILKAVEMHLSAFPVNEVSTRRLDAMLFAESKMGLTAVPVLLGLGVLTLIVACINYASLSTAQAAGRTKEFGMRRVMGAGGVLVAVQAWLDALLLTLAALVLAIGILALASPFIVSTMDVDVIYFLTRGPEAWGVIAAIVGAVSLVAGLYPALVLSRIRPADALRSGKSRSGPGFVARILVGVQFASASFLLILVTVAQQQRLHLEDLALAPHRDPIVALNDLRPLGISVDTAKAELEAVPGVKSVTFADRLPWTTNASVMNFVRTLDPGATSPSGYLKQVGYGYFETLDLGLVAGRVFEPGRETVPTRLLEDNGPNPIPLVIDRAYAEALGFETPQAAIGKVVYMPAALSTLR